MCKCKMGSLLFPINKYLVYLVIIINASSVSPIQPKPKIWLSGYVREDAFQITEAEEQFQLTNYENEFVSKKGNDFIISGSTRLIIFTCESSYPIKWKLPFPQQLKSIDFRGVKSKGYRISEFKENSDSPINTAFKITNTVRFKYGPFLSANLTCISTDNHTDARSSIYIYWAADKQRVEHQGQTIHIKVEPWSSSSNSATAMNQSQVVIPCRPSYPSLKLILEKESIPDTRVGEAPETIATKWAHVTPDNNLQYDPKVGFTFKREIIGNQIFGLYRCSVLYTDDNGKEIPDIGKFVFVNVTKESNRNNKSAMESGFQPRSTLSGNARVFSVVSDFKYEIIPRHLVACCSGVHYKRPKLYARFCYNTLTCETVKSTMVGEIDGDIWKDISAPNWFQGDKLDENSTDCSSAVLFGETTMVMCQGENVDYADEFVQVFRPEVSGPVVNRSERTQASYAATYERTDYVTAEERITLLSKFETATSIKKSNDLTEKMVILMGHLIPNSRELPSLVLTQLKDKLVDAADVGGPDLSQEPPLKVYLKEYDRDVYYDGEPITFMCLGLNVFYSSEPYMRINFKNGTKTILNPKVVTGWKEKTNLFLSGNGRMFDGFGEDLVIIITESEVAHLEMSSIDCWMPSKDTETWDKVSRSLQIVSSVAPKFVENEDETVYHYVGDVNKKLTCTVVEGIPLPDLTVTKNGEMLSLNRKRGTDNDTKIIQDVGWKNGTRVTGSVENNNNVVKLNIDFDVITLDHQLEWKCIANNVNGTVTRIIKVFVTGRRSNVLPISIGVAATLMLVLIGLIVKHWRDKRNANSIQTVIDELAK